MMRTFELLKHPGSRAQARGENKKPGIPKGASLLVLATLMSLAVAPIHAAVQAQVDFANVLQTWDGFGVNYVETAQSRDYRTTPEDYGGFGLMSEAQRREVLEKTFGADGLKPGIIKMFLDPFHEGYTKEGNDNDDPHVINLDGFDHTTTTKWMRYYAREGLALTCARGDDLQVIVTLYGPAPWMTKQKFVRGRDLDPAEKYECAEYMISWAKYLREEEGLPVNYISLHNEGEASWRWPADGMSAGTPDHDHNMYWPTNQVVDFLRFMRGMLDAQGMQGVGLTPGETTHWQRLHGLGYAGAIAGDPLALYNLGLITSHGFDPKTSPNWETGVAILRAERPELHAWTTSMSWGNMDTEFVDTMRRHIYEVKVNAIIPWATIQRFGGWIGGDPNSGTAFNVDDEGNISVKPGYYFFKQVSRAGQPGMAVASVSSSDPDIKLMAFARHGTEHPDAFVVINTGDKEKSITVRVKGSDTTAFCGWRTSQTEQYSEAGRTPVEGGSLRYAAPVGSVTTFFAEPGKTSASSNAKVLLADDFRASSRGARLTNLGTESTPVGLSFSHD